MAGHKRFSDARKRTILAELAAGAAPSDLGKKYHFNYKSLYAWRARLGGGKPAPITAAASNGYDSPRLEAISEKIVALQSEAKIVREVGEIVAKHKADRTWLAEMLAACRDELAIAVGLGQGEESLAEYAAAGPASE